MPNSNSLKQKTMKGLFWSFMDLLAKGGMQIIIQVILARILLPEHFGLIGMVIVFIALSNLLVDSGFSRALIRDENTTQEDYSTVFYFNLFVSLLVYVLLFLCAESISLFFGEPQLILIIRVLSFVIIINSLAIIQRIKLVKNIDFKTITLTSVVAVIISGIITITMAVLGFGVWSLVVNMVSMQVIQTVLLWYYNKWIPSLVFSSNSLKKFFGFGSKLLVSDLIDTLYNNLFYIIIGRVYTKTQLGYYTNAVKFRDFAALSISNTVERVAYPVLSSIQNDEDRLKAAFKKVIKTSAFINFPLMVGLATIATPLFSIVLGEKWLPAVIYFQLLCIAGMLYPTHITNLSILQVKGRSDLFLLMEVIKKVNLTVLIILSLYLKLGIIGLISATLLNTFISLFVNTYFSGKEISYSTKEQIKDLFPTFALSIVMGIIVFTVGSLLPFNHYMNLTIQIILGVSFYMIICKLMKNEELKTVYSILIGLLLKVKLTLNKGVSIEADALVDERSTENKRQKVG
ncbi:lipopolysaccharide biosynthesis protein [Sporosarcina siberiensis]|uniref:Lipopolysaccharide biosynthesis protein n=1 Tax=Sporosarcina siberiensis TaxID=1365606 RepID=A0ABW4SDJ8_9BACL